MKKSSVAGKRFSWQKKRLILSVFLISALFFLIYQIIFLFLLGHSQYDEIQEEPHTLKNIVKQSIENDELLHIFNEKGLIRGVHLSNIKKYIPNEKGMFTCITSKAEIDFSMINDDYCDCPEDGSDEPGTNACNNGKFYCNHQPKHTKIKPLVIPSSRVNDGICDCCDGSDEWNNVSIIKSLSSSLQKKLGKYQVPCTNYCLSRL